MYRHRRWHEDPADRQAEDRRTAGLAGIAIVLLLIIGGLFLVQQLRTAARIQDCLMSGRRDCDMLVLR